jgi:hypothetical protein
MEGINEVLKSKFSDVEADIPYHSCRPVIAQAFYQEVFNPFKTSEVGGVHVLLYESLPGVTLVKVNLELDVRSNF